ncbi:MAG: alkaline phosphatase family protein [Armatimonadetes bacterium]|nr:alkaline phosphatase family protein [Armatimonadota bacterium]
MSARTRLIIFGIDSADWNCMGPFLEEGLLPNLKALIEQGTSAPLRSTIPPITSCAWPSIMTGTNPGKHGMFGFLTSTARPRLGTNADRQAPALWEILNASGLRVGFFNVPLTYPPDPVDGFMVAGEIGAPAFVEKIFYPPHLFAEARKAVFKYPLRFPGSNLPERKQLALWREIALTRHKLCMQLLKNHPVDVLVAVVNYVDYVQHSHLVNRRVGDMPDIVAWSYQQADALLGEILNSTESECPVLVVSDHGSIPVQGYMDINAFLYTQGWLEYSPAVGRRSIGGLLYRKAARAYDALLSKRLPMAIAARLAVFARRVAYSNIIEWSRTKAFFGNSYGVIINTPGRSPSPTVSEKDRLAVAKDIAAAISDLVNPLTGKKDIVAFLREDLYHGPALEAAPDIIVMPQEFALVCFLGPAFSEQVFYSEAELREAGMHTRLIQEGTHRLEGVLIASPPLPSMPDQPTVMDIAPTALGLLGLPIPSHMDGRDLTGQASSAREGHQQPVLQREKPSEEKVYSAEEEAAVMKRLQDLGYL